MSTDDEDRLLQQLGEPECHRLLRTARIGRLAFTEGALPDVVPVAFTVDGDALVIPARGNSRVVGAVRGSVVALAVDSYDVDTGTGWGVTAVGPSRVLAGSGGAAAGTCSIVVRIGLLRGWRLSLPVVRLGGRNGLPAGCDR
ncbi:pyridoxamine 5'-phosphate oxidase family protein [Blastococcus litoris]|uniref:pyridoxamine 5'-phosphate oxidase family protein n=1 Tax=Blastococcus litoris TaxID=2171622 RepID=UPI0013DF0C86|nr:pyridoxamine 5'-phosphate oxidase family protein [Blastococcus litoris]